MGARRVPPRSLNAEAQRRELDRITSANQDLLKRLQNSRSSVDPRGWEDQEVDRQALKFRLSQNSRHGRMLKLPLPERSQRPEFELSESSQLIKLPKINAAQSAHVTEDDWVRFSNTELDRHLIDLENAQSVDLPLALTSR